jgi:Flp pilus assembly protein TadB
MPSRKQRRRREKSFRHEYEFVTVDDEGNEVEVDPQDLRADKEKAKPAKSASKSQAKQQGRGGGSTRTMQPPSWRRVGKRGLIFAPLMFLAVAFIDKGRNGYGVYFVQTVFLLAFFLPFSYVMDSFAYRMYLKRTGQLPQRGDTKDAKGQATRSPR